MLTGNSGHTHTHTETHLWYFPEKGRFMLPDLFRHLAQAFCESEHMPLRRGTRPIARTCSCTTQGQVSQMKLCEQKQGIEATANTSSLSPNGEPAAEINITHFQKGRRGRWAHSCITILQLRCVAQARIHTHTHTHPPTHQATRPHPPTHPTHPRTHPSIHDAPTHPRAHAPTPRAPTHARTGARIHALSHQARACLKVIDATTHRSARGYKQ